MLKQQKTWETEEYELPKYMQAHGFRSYVLRERERVTIISREKIVPTVFSLRQKVTSKLVAFLKMKQ